MMVNLFPPLWRFLLRVLTHFTTADFVEICWFHGKIKKKKNQKPQGNFQ